MICPCCKSSGWNKNFFIVVNGYTYCKNCVVPKTKEQRTIKMNTLQTELNNNENKVINPNPPKLTVTFIWDNNNNLKVTCKVACWDKLSDWVSEPFYFSQKDIEQHIKLGFESYKKSLVTAMINPEEDKEVAIIQQDARDKTFNSELINYIINHNLEDKKD